jgi:hemolysin III
MGPHDITPFVFRQPVSAGTHLLGCLWALLVVRVLWALARGDRLRQGSVGCFGLSMVLLYGASAAYHATPASAPRLIDYLRMLDQSAIYLLIAGTYTPIFAVLLRGRLRSVMLALVWGLAGTGIACRWLLPAPPNEVTVGLYLALGAVGLTPAPALARAIGLRGLAWGLLGALLYTLGGLCDAACWPILYPRVVGYHEVLHLLDLGGTFTHVFFIVHYVLPFRRGRGL